MEFKLPFSVDRQFLERVAKCAPGSSAKGIITAEERALNVSALQLLLIRQTLEHAYIKVPFYKSWMDEQDFDPIKFSRIKDLALLKILSRSTAESRRDNMIARDTKVVTLRSTSGTTSGHSFSILIGDEEDACQRTWHDIQTANNSPRIEDILLHVKPATQRVMSPSKGGDFELSALYNIDAPAPFRMDVGYDDFIIQQLFENFPVPGTSGRITILRCVPPFILAMLTNAMRHRNINPHDTAVRQIIVAGGTVTAALCDMAKRDWNASIWSVYSCAELTGYAGQFGTDPRVYSFGADVFAEVLDIDTLQPVAIGEDGLLVLTSLYPFQMAQPFIRYEVGDIATYLGSIEDGFPGFTFKCRGRSGQCPNMEPWLGPSGRRHVIGTADVESALSRFPEIPADFAPRFKLAVNANGLVIDVETVAMIGAHWLNELSARIEQAVREEFSAGADYQQLPISVQLHAKGTLKNPFRLYPSR